jgi:TolB-like protein
VDGTKQSARASFRGPRSFREHSLERFEALEVKHLTSQDTFPVDAPESVSPSWLSQHRKTLRFFAALVSVLTIGVMLLAFGTRRATAPGKAQPKTVAVLPFKPLNPTSRDEALEIGMAEALIARLSGIGQIVVRPIGAVRGYAETPQEAVDVGDELQADVVLGGNLERTADRVKVSVHLDDVRNRVTLWSQEFDESAEGIFEIQDSISKRITHTLALRLNNSEQQNLTRRPTNSPQAYQLFLQSELLKDKRDYKQSLETYRKTLETDPNFALAFAGLGDACLKLIAEGTQKHDEADVLMIARASLAKALELDESLAEAHSSLAEVTYKFDFDWSKAEAEFKKAIDLNPNSANIRLAYGGFLLSLARFDASVVQMQKAQELDPNSLLVQQSIGVVCYFQRNYDESLRRFQKILQVDPNYEGALWWIENNYQQKVMFAEAFDTAIQDGLRTGRLSKHEAERRRKLFSESGWQGILRFRLAREKQKPKSAISHRKLAALYAQLGERDQAFSQLQAAIDQRDPFVTWLKIEPQYDSLRSDPRYRELLAQINMSP